MLVGLIVLGMVSGRCYGIGPNIVIYLGDDVGIGTVNQHAPEWSVLDDASYLEEIDENRRILTPNLERLAKEGKRFMRSYAGSSVCGPSRHSLLTGVQVGMQYAKGNGYGENGIVDVDLMDGTSTIGKALQDHGYVTGAFGKWGVSGSATSEKNPCTQGFDKFYGMLTHVQMGHAFPASIYSCNGNNPLIIGQEDFPENNDPSKEKCVDTNSCTYFDYKIREKALEFITDHQNDQFFVYWATSGGHVSLYEQAAKHQNCELKTHPVPSFGNYTSEKIGDRSTDEIRGLMAMTEYTIDQDIGLLLSHLENLGLDTNTLIIFTSDNGPHKEAFADADYNPIVDLVATGGMKGIKRRMYEGSLRMPTIAWWPGTIPAETTSFYPFMLYDFPLTLAKVAEIPDNDVSLDPFKTTNAGGISLYDLLISNDDSVVSSQTREWVYAELCYVKGGTNAPGKVCPIRWSPAKGCTFAYYDLSQWPNHIFKVMKNLPTSEIEMYDVLNDPFETIDLSNSQNYQTLKQNMLANRELIRIPSCPVEDDYDARCYDDPCNIHKTSSTCTNDASCSYNSNNSPYKCTTTTSRPTQSPQSPTPFPTTTERPTQSPQSPTPFPTTTERPTHSPTTRPTSRPNRTI